MSIIPIILENDDFLVINKPAGLIVHGDGKHPEDSVADWVEKTYPDSVGVGELMRIEHAGKTIDIPRSGIVHRIDRDTSGVLLIAKTQEAFEKIKEQFQVHTIKKKYLAIVFGWPREDRGIIDVPIGRSSSNIRAKSAQRNARGVLRAAITRYVVKKRFEHDGQKFAVVELYPQTGRTHQLRVHMGHLGHPLVGDPIYAGKKTATLPIKRTALHAEKLTFQDLDGKTIEASAPLPADFQAVIDLAK